MTPGERANHWAKALVTIWPIILILLGGTVYGNSDKVKAWIHGEAIDPIGDVTQPTHDNFDQQVTTAINQITEQLKKQNAQTERHAANERVRDEKNFEALDARLTTIEGLVN